jgi:hypothetical protein
MGVVPVKYPPAPPPPPRSSLFAAPPPATTIYSTVAEVQVGPVSNVPEPLKVWIVLPP